MALHNNRHPLLLCVLSLFVLLQLLAVFRPFAVDATGLPSGGGCCCCQQQAAPPPPPPQQSCCCCGGGGGGRRKRQLFSGLAELEKYVAEQEQRMYCCGATGRKRRHTGQPVSRRVEFWGGSALSSLMYH
ncbi:hypothetical protein niasHT_031669 [Heterodera trifolii]|uniref:Uncharacterized protein n=1 Tax=Heterodera trifolii TaxID=157864 RepID=A0ABD2IXZ1_9BILA